MGQFHSIFCASGGPLTRAEIAEWANDSWFGDDPLVFEPPPDTVLDWEKLEVRVPGIGPPVVFLQGTAPAQVRGEVALVSDGLPARLAQRLSGTCRIVGIDLAPDLLDDDVWELLDVVQSLIATRLDGVIFAPDGVYDHELRPIIPLRRAG